jgi:pyruvate dehydrogenase E2 component (dihydrolipoamide acetyltransferase)
VRLLGCAQLKKGEAVVVVESDKADMDVETFYDGFLAAISVSDGSVAAVGAPIAYIAETKEEIAAAKAKAGGAPPAAAPAPAPAAAAPPPPPPPAAAAPAAPKPAAAAAAAPPPPPPPPAAPVAAAPARTDGKVFITPYARKLAKDLKVDLAAVHGTGLLGRVTAEDVEAAAGRGKPAAATPAARPAAAAPAPAAAAPAAKAAAPAAAPAKAAVQPGGHTEPLPGMQLAVAKNMLVSLSVRLPARLLLARPLDTATHATLPLPPSCRCRYPAWR